MKKYLMFCLFVAFIGLTLSGCDSCDQENPSVVLLNNGTDKADIQIKTSGGNTENINNIEVGTRSERRTFAPGDIEFTIAIQGVSDEIVYILSTSFCYDYIVTINEDNTVTYSSQPRD
ncbi:hypothetical protein ACFLTH_08710 [Bacteroidota bacterium]